MSEIKKQMINKKSFFSLLFLLPSFCLHSGGGMSGVDGEVGGEVRSWFVSTRRGGGGGGGRRRWSDGTVARPSSSSCASFRPGVRDSPSPSSSSSLLRCISYLFSLVEDFLESSLKNRQSLERFSLPPSRAHASFSPFLFSLTGN